MPDEITNIGAPVRARLQNLSRQTGQTFELVLTRYALVRLLYRLSVSAHSERFVLKGAMLLTTWFAEPYRATRDLDLLGFGDPGPENLVAVFHEILATELSDGVDFDLDGLRADPIRERPEYGGVRVRTVASIGGARIAVTADVGFGDALEPALRSSTTRRRSACRRRGSGPTLARRWLQRSSSPWLRWAWSTAG
jgi:hypothetical protein